MPMLDYKCSKCGFVDEYYTGPNYKNDIPEKCPSCNEGVLEKQFPNCSRVGVDVLGGYEYQYGKKAYKKKMTPMEYAGHLVKGEDGKYKDPY
jgi:hypothetical protein